jgi:HlyD family secretion protein
VELATAARPFETTLDEDAARAWPTATACRPRWPAALARIVLREGDEVKAGDVVAELQPACRRCWTSAACARQQARVEGAQAGCCRRGKRIERARVALEQARTTCAQRTAGPAGLHRPHQARHRPPVAAGGPQKELDAAVDRRATWPATTWSRRAWRWAWCAQAGRGGRPRLRTVRAPVAGQVLRVRANQRGGGGAGHAAGRESATCRAWKWWRELLTTDALQARPAAPCASSAGAGRALQGRVRRVEPAAFTKVSASASRRAFTKVSALGVEEQRSRSTCSPWIDIWADQPAPG